MKLVLTITSAFLAIANARPDVSHLPSGSYLPVGSGDYSGTLGLGSGYQQVDEEKSVYFYGSPNDEQYSRFRISVIPNSKKNTKIIFVKAPHHAGVIPEVIAPPSLAEDKTLVYVLVKKPSEGQSISIPAGVGVKHAKPEVFFIKYNNKHEAEAQVNGGVNGQLVGVNVPDLPNEQAFVSTLGNNGHVNAGDIGISSHVGTGGDGGHHGPTGISGPY
ncbi:hypothetical protein FQR65_LT03449 [Abscondita terminalis]|nr:hypothetical protein FQR65_LT03449 [Abscondita terminalis]